MAAGTSFAQARLTPGLSRRVYYDLVKDDDIVLEDGANKLTVHRVDLTEYVTLPACVAFILRAHHLLVVA